MRPPPPSSACTAYGGVPEDGQLHRPQLIRLERLIGAGPCVIVTVLEVHGSAPRAPGSRMFVTMEGQEGSVGGGNLEFHAAARARELLLSGQAGQRTEETYGLGPSLNQCCGGAVKLGFELLQDARPKIPKERSLPLTLFGAGHVGSALVPLLADLPLDVRWVDGRPERFPGTLPANCEAIVSDRPVREVTRAPGGSLFLVMTHSHELDEDICFEALTRTDSPWLGLIGSDTKRARFVHRLAQRGVEAAALKRLACPVGHAGIAGKRPATIAVSVAAQLLMEHIPAEWR